ncbi:MULTISPECIES: glycoside hydrolase family 43 protein [unclassified Sphingomonas]|uniref:glycoside hydrolase family 43 protein n=1 Tax=unclassified Sphingomonas TaxID=196159 RepID=UPI000925E550|nr:MULTISPECIES: glycoside hydrolase family 43 protein [unclassified Sphingomonas]OJU17974.1 MAG: alpha-N-arabinofuranosidase [Sphingomonas sp. 66-10]
MRRRRITSITARGTAVAAALVLGALVSGCKSGERAADNGAGLSNATAAKDGKRPASDYLSQPLVSEIYTADPSAHVWNGTLYIYPSHDIDGPTPEDDLGGHFEMRDYHVLSMTEPNGKVTVHPVALDVKQVPWAEKQMWAPDAAYKNGTYYLYFPAKDKAGAFRIGVATSKSPVGPFKADPEPINGSFSIDPAVFTDDDGKSYMYFGGIWGGQLQRNVTGSYDPNGSKTDLKADDKPALTAKVARLDDGMRQFAEKPRDVVILDEKGKPLLGGDHDRRFFEASFLHKYKGKYYFSYSTGDTHFLNYAIGDNPYGPFTYKGHFLLPVEGWTTHHSIVEWKGRWWLFYADSQLSGQTRLRNVKMTELFYNPDGTIKLINPFVK